MSVQAFAAQGVTHDSPTQNDVGHAVRSAVCLGGPAVTAGHESTRPELIILDGSYRWVGSMHFSEWVTYNALSKLREHLVDLRT